MDKKIFTFLCPKFFFIVTFEFRQCLFLFQLLNACINNCGREFHLEVSSRDFVSECRTLIGQKVLISCIQGLPWLRICCSQHFSQMKKSWGQMKLTLAKVLARKYQQVVLYLTHSEQSGLIWIQTV